jgi:hypothetical protein
MMDNWGIHSHEKVSMPLETLLAISWQICYVPHWQ